MCLIDFKKVTFENKLLIYDQSSAIDEYSLDRWIENKIQEYEITERKIDRYLEMNIQIEGLKILYWKDGQIYKLKDSWID